MYVCFHGNQLLWQWLMGHLLLSHFVDKRTQFVHIVNEQFTKHGYSIGVLFLMDTWANPQTTSPWKKAGLCTCYAKSSPCVAAFHVTSGLSFQQKTSCTCAPALTHGEDLNTIIYMWQSRVEIEGYSVAHFDRITAFEAPYCWTSVKGGAHTRFVGLLDIHASTKCVWAPPLAEIQRYGVSNTAIQSKYATE